MTTVERIVGVEPVEIHLDPLQAKFAGRAIADPSIIGEPLALGMKNQYPGSLEEEIMKKAIGNREGEPLWGGRYPRMIIEVLDLECDEKSSRGE